MPQEDLSILKTSPSAGFFIALESSAGCGSQDQS